MGTKEKKKEKAQTRNQGSNFSIGSVLKSYLVPALHYSSASCHYGQGYMEVS